ncbi:hypothetical protein NE848_04240 [Gramella jeungdoensis]|uniref:DUF4412 domain-containing protein n=1 Tax=Gramella jeungdoensis TaxID=708091 RepID=A0ABT0Z196_9FLAO|nr:hypothetical protein [Gramella jeungdoensis]MCM8568574.1 hypothetical protein [Gramella jeungdoensis]
MRKIFTILLLAVAAQINAQSFEGTLTYTVDFELSEKMLDMGLTREMMKSRMEAEGTWADTVSTSYKDGFYRQLNLSPERSWLVYRPDDKKLYTFQEKEVSDICIVTDTSIDQEYEMTGEMPTLTLLDTIVEYKDYTLETVKVEWKSGTYYYLFDKEHFKVDPENFRGHIYDAFYDFLKISGSLPIRIVKEAGGMMSVNMDLVDASESEIDESIFEIPELIEDEELNSLSMGTGKMMRVK